MSIILVYRKDDQMSSRRALVYFGIGIALILGVTVVLVLTLGKGDAPLLPADTPQGTVQRYLLAVQQKDYAGAYSFITPSPTPTDSFKSPPPGPPTSFSFWMMSAQNASGVSWKATLDKAAVTGSTANVQISVEVFRPGGPLSNPVHTLTEIFLLTQEGNSWLITSPTDLYWLN
jgi:hypothetical protein